jgi:hypothetical protein
MFQHEGMQLHAVCRTMHAPRQRTVPRKKLPCVLSQALLCLFLLGIVRVRALRTFDLLSREPHQRRIARESRCLNMPPKVEEGAPLHPRLFVKPTLPNALERHCLLFLALVDAYKLRTLSKAAASLLREHLRLLPSFAWAHRHVDWPPDAIGQQLSLLQGCATIHGGTVVPPDRPRQSARGAA